MNGIKEKVYTNLELQLLQSFYYITNIDVKRGIIFLETLIDYKYFLGKAASTVYIPFYMENLYIEIIDK